jgi:Protein of unknown function (DUF3313)
VNPIRPLSLAICAFAAAIFATGCANQQLSLKAKNVAPSAFLTHPEGMQPMKERAPFDKVWVNPAHPDLAAGYKAIYIAPVNTQYLRAVDRPLVTVMEGPKAKDRPASQTAEIIHTSFTQALQKWPAPRLQFAAQPGPGVLTVQLALVELNPTNVMGNAVKYGAPGGSVLAPVTKGNIAIEGKVQDSKTKTLLYEFADNEQDKFAVVSLRDLSSYGHARQSIYDWAKEFAELVNTPPTHKVVGASPVTLNPF